MKTWWHRLRGHRAAVLPDIYGHSRKRAYYCSCGKDWVGR